MIIIYKGGFCPDIALEWPHSVPFVFERLLAISLTMDFNNERTKTCFAIAGMATTVVCFIFDMVGLTTDEWQKREDTDSDNVSKAGLWTCTHEMCDRDEGRMMASQVCGVIGAVMMIECMVVEGVMMKSKGFRKYGIRMFIVMDAFGFLCMVTEFAMYVNTTAMEAAGYGYSSVLTILAFLLSIAGGICCVVAYSDEMKGTSASYPVSDPVSDQELQDLPSNAEEEEQHNENNH